MSNKAKQPEIQDEEAAQMIYSAEVAVEFVNEEILSRLEEFENNNDDPEYVHGFATHGLFIELIMRLGAMGYTEKDLRKEIKEWINSSYGEVVH
jgi:hypothetical protein